MAVYLTVRTVLSLCPQSDVVQQSIYNLVHKDDRETFRRQLQVSELSAGSKKPTLEVAACANKAISHQAGPVRFVFML